LQIPVVGLLETAVHLAYILGRRFSVITTKEGGKTATEDLLRLYDCTTRCASIKIIDLQVLKL
jgi:allantoin racemase